MNSAAPAVAMRGIVKRFPGVVANNGVDFEAAVGEVHALLGENGAGKSTLSNILTGLYRPDAGSIELHGTPVTFSSPRQALAAGVGMVHQDFRLVTPFTVAENVVLGHPDAPLIARPALVAARVREIADRYGMAIDPDARIWQLSVGEQQRVEILKALYRDAKVLILDEPTAVLTPLEADALFVTLRSMVAEGRTVIFISHKLDEVMAVSDRVTVLRDGKTVGTVLTADTSPRQLAAMMVGREVLFSRVTRQRPPTPEKIALEVRELSADDDRGGPALHEVSLRIARGEIVGIAGVAGNGQRELAEVLTGLRPATAGTVYLDGAPVATGNARAAIAARVAHIPEDRMHTGVAPSHAVEDNLVLKAYRRPPMARWSFLRRRHIRHNATQLTARFDVKAPSTTTPVRLLSGGNVQKVVLARELSTDPRVLIAAAPTRGLDVGATETLRRSLTDAADQGVAVLLISEDLEEILALADRVAVIYEGRIVADLDAHDADRETLGVLMGGG